MWSVIPELNLSIKWKLQLFSVRCRVFSYLCVQLLNKMKGPIVFYMLRCDQVNDLCAQLLYKIKGPVIFCMLRCNQLMLPVSSCCIKRKIRWIQLGCISSVPLGSTRQRQLLYHHALNRPTQNTDARVYVSSICSLSGLFSVILWWSCSQWFCKEAALGDSVKKRFSVFCNEAVLGDSVVRLFTVILWWSCSR